MRNSRLCAFAPLRENSCSDPVAYAERPGYSTSCTVKIAIAPAMNAAV